jgi:hypothetical protein
MFMRRSVKPVVLRALRVPFVLAVLAALASVGLFASSAQPASLRLKAESGSVSVPDVTVNWAGYVATGTDVSSVSGQWTVPHAGTIPGVAGTWVGVGGYSTSDLIQEGTSEVGTPTNDVTGLPQYQAWYEALPDGEVALTGCSGDSKCTVAPGDEMKASVTAASGCSPNTKCNWTVEMSDVTQGWTYSTTVSYDSSQSSAEWIHEAPSLSVGPLPGVPVPVGGPVTVTFDGTQNSALGNFGSGSSGGDIAKTGAFPVEALPGETTTSALDTGGDGFNVCTYALTCSPPS